MRAWTIGCVAALHMLSRSGQSLAQIAHTLGRTSAECDRALWTLVGRSIPDAVSVLNGARPKGLAA